MLLKFRLPKFKLEVKSMLNALLPSYVVGHVSWLRTESVNNSWPTARYSGVYLSSCHRASRQHSMHQFHPTEYHTLGGTRKSSSDIIEEKEDLSPTIQLITDPIMCDVYSLPR